MEEFRRTLRRDLLGELEARRARRTRLALFGLSTAAATLAVVCALFVLRPAWPQSLHAVLFHDATASAEPADADLQRVLDGSGASAGADRKWIEGLYANQAIPARVKALDGERIFALRRFELTSGERVVVLTEIAPPDGATPTAAIPAVRSF